MKFLKSSNQNKKRMRNISQTDACVEPVLNFNEVESNLQNRSRNIFIRENNILQANIAPKFSRSIPKNTLELSSMSKTIKQISKEWGID